MKQEVKKKRTFKLRNKAKEISYFQVYLLLCVNTVDIFDVQFSFFLFKKCIELFELVSCLNF